MATFCDGAEKMFTFLESHGVELDPALRDACCDVISREHSGDRIHIPPAGSKKDPRRKAEIIDALRRLPPLVVAERYGIHPSYAYRLNKAK